MILQSFWHNRAVTYLVLTLLFGGFYALNNAITAPLLLAPGAHLVHLPSGIKFLLVLVFGLVGALSIFTVSLCAALAFYFTGDPLLSFELAVANGLAPLKAATTSSIPGCGMPMTGPSPTASCGVTTARFNWPDGKGT